MTAQEFLISVLKGWSSCFGGVKFNYAYDTVAEYHIIEVKPEEIRRGNSEYKNAEMQLWMRFIELYPDENLLITNPSNANDMTNLVYSNEHLSTERLTEYCTHSCLDGYCELGYRVCDGTACSDYDRIDKEMD